MIEKISKIMLNGMLAIFAISIVTVIVVLAYYNPIFPLILVIMGGIGLLMNYLGWDIV